MRGCAKRDCDAQAAVTVAMRYEPREVVVLDLVAEPEPGLLDLCTDHADGLSPPLGWRITDGRRGIASGA